MADVGHFGCPNSLSGHFRPFHRSHFEFPKLTFDRNSGHFFRRPFCMSENHFGSHFWLIGHFGCPKLTFDGISGHFRSIQNLFIFKFFWQNGRRRPFWMSTNNFRSHFWPFQIDTQLYFFWIFWTKWPPAAILDGTTMSIIEPSEIFGWVMHVSSLKNVV